MEVKYREEQVITSPYVTQADKMAVSLRHLADRFLKMEPKKQCFTPSKFLRMKKASGYFLPKAFLTLLLCAEQNLILLYKSQLLSGDFLDVFICSYIFFQFINFF